MCGGSRHVGLVSGGLRCVGLVCGGFRHVGLVSGGLVGVWRIGWCVEDRDM